jgi:hypothetical protein
VTYRSVVRARNKGGGNKVWKFRRRKSGGPTRGNRDGSGWNKGMKGSRKETQTSSSKKCSSGECDSKSNRKAKLKSSLGLWLCGSGASGVKINEVFKGRM